YKKSAFVLDDTVVNVWASGKDAAVEIRVDGKAHSGSRRRPVTQRDPRNSSFMTGRLSLGDRHIVEVSGTEAELIAADSKIALGREQIGVQDARWQIAGKNVQPLASAWGAPYGNSRVLLQPGQKA